MILTPRDVCETLCAELSRRDEYPTPRALFDAFPGMQTAEPLLDRMAEHAKREIGADVAVPLDKYEWLALERMFPVMTGPAERAFTHGVIAPLYIPENRLVIVPGPGIGPIVSTPGTMLAASIHELGHASEHKVNGDKHPRGAAISSIEYALGEAVAEGCAWLCLQQLVGDRMRGQLVTHHISYIFDHVNAYLGRYGSRALVELILQSQSFVDHLSRVNDHVWNVLDNSSVGNYTAS